MELNQVALFLTGHLDALVIIPYGHLGVPLKHSDGDDGFSLLYNTNFVSVCLLLFNEIVNSLTLLKLRGRVSSYCRHLKLSSIILGYEL